MQSRVVIQEGSGRRRRWTKEEKGRIVALTLAPGVKVSDVAREYDLSPQNLFQWRREAKTGKLVLRERVSAVEPRCRLTGVTNPLLLIASHIKPWRLCQTARERLDGMNGLMLTPDADRLFDRGFVTFNDDGRALASPRADPDDLRRLGLEGILTGLPGSNWVPGRFRAEQ